MFLVALLFSHHSAHAVPLQLTQQGRMLDGNGLSVSGLELVAFRIYDDPLSGSLLWEDYITVDFNNGYYAAVLGSDVVNNPLDSNVLSLYPLHLELQLGGNSPMSPRQEINSSPFAQIAGIAESVEGGTVNASEISVSGNTIIDGTGTWVGQPMTVDWANITAIPAEFLDGDDNTQLSDSQVETYVTNGPIDLNPNTTMNGNGLLTQADTLNPDWVNIINIPSDFDDNIDDDTLNGLGCNPTEIVGWDGNDWICVSDNSLSDTDVLSIISNNTVDLDAASSINGQDFVTSLDATLESLNCQDGDIARWDETAIMWVCSSDSLGMLSCLDGEIQVYNESQMIWECSSLQDSFDSDADGILSWFDCDDNDPNALSQIDDADCDGFLSEDDCDDSNPLINPDAIEDNTDGVDNDCDGNIDSSFGFTMDGSLYVSTDTFQGDFNAAQGFCTQLVGQTAYIVSFSTSVSGSYPSGIWQGNAGSSSTAYNCSLYSSANTSHEGYGTQGNYGSCSQYRHVVCSTDTSHCHSADCTLWD